MKLLSEDKDITVARMALTMTTLFQSVTPSLIDSNSIKTFQEALNPENFSIQANSNIQGLITSFLQTEEILRNEVNTCLKVITPKAIEANQKVQEIDGKEKKLQTIKGIINEVFGSKEFKDYVESAMAYLEAKYLMCCMVLRLTASNLYKYIAPNISNNK